MVYFLSQQEDNFQDLLVREIIINYKLLIADFFFIIILIP